MSNYSSVSILYNLLIRAKCLLQRELSRCEKYHFHYLPKKVTHCIRMKKLERGNQCLNCNKSLSKEDAFCPSCGQKNVDNNISFSQLTGDFFSNYFTLDSRFIRSILPFLFKPGVLTIRFNEGKRKAYANQ